MVKQLISIFSHFRSINVLVVGDYMIDTYTTGQTKRISPEAPVMIFHVNREESRPGGAGNVVLNLCSLKVKVKALGRVGNDFAGFELKEALAKEGVNVEGLIQDPLFKTPLKNRLIAGAQQVLRVDTENITPLSSDLENELIEKIPSLLEGVQIVAISDYGKGFLTRRLLEALIHRAKERSIPVIVDPKGDDFTKYRGSTLIKPNASEAYAASKLSSEASLDQVAKALLEMSEAELLLITRSELGMSLFDTLGKRVDFRAKEVQEVTDVTGAGDTVLAMMSVALGNELDLDHAIQLSNIAAGIAIERLGCARITLSDMADRLLEYDVVNKIFEENHLFALSQVLTEKKFSVLGINAAQGMTTALFRAIKSLSDRQTECKLIIYLSDYKSDEEFISLLSSLSEVDFIVIGSDSLQHLCGAIHPHAAYLMKGTHLCLVDHPLELLALT